MLTATEVTADYLDSLEPAEALVLLQERELDLEDKRTTTASLRRPLIAKYLQTHSQADLARLLGISEARVSQLKRAAGL